MEKSREEQLQKVELRAEEASKLYREFIAWKHKVISFAKPELYYFGMTKSRKEKAETPNNLVSVICDIVRKPTDLKNTFMYQDAQLALQEKKQQEKLKEEARQKEIDELNEEAIIYLLSHGKILGKDFSIKDASYVADSLAFELEKERVLKEKSWFSFSGDDYCENCSGWDGTSHRCECGNRRVGWEFGYDHSFKHPSIRAEAN